MYEMIEVERTRAGDLVTVHTKDCAECNAQGVVEARVCSHIGSACPCSGAEEKCPECHGDKTVTVVGCDCARCCAAAEKVEAAS